MDRTGHRPIWIRKFLPYAWLPVHGIYDLLAHIVKLVPLAHLAVMYANTADDAPWSYKVEAHFQSRTQSNDFNDHVSASSFSELFHSLVETLSVCLEVPWFRAQRFCKV